MIIITRKKTCCFVDELLGHTALYSLVHNVTTSTYSIEAFKMKTFVSDFKKQLALKLVSSSKLMAIVSPSTGWDLAGGKTEGVVVLGVCG